MSEEESKELVLVVKQDEVALFSQENGLDPFIQRVKEEVNAEVYDISTKAGRARINSVCRKIGGAKSTLKSYAKGLTEESRVYIKSITSETTRMEGEFDAIRDEIKAPLDAYNEKEDNRKAAHEKHLDCIRETAIADVDSFPCDTAIEIIEAYIKEITEALEIDFEEFSDRRDAAAEISLNALNIKLNNIKAQKEKDDQLAELLKEKAERDKKDPEAKIAQDAADKAKADAEAKADADKKEAEIAAQKLLDDADAEKKRIEGEKEAAEQRTKDAEAKAKADADKAAADAVAAKEQADNDKKAAIDAERARADKETADAQAEKTKREEDQAHRKIINNEALDDIQKIIQKSLDSKADVAKAIVCAIAKGEIDNVVINY